MHECIIARLAVRLKGGAEVKGLKIDRSMWAGGFGGLTAPTGLRAADCPTGNEVLYTAFRRHRLTLFTFPLLLKETYDAALDKNAYEI